MNTLLDSAYMFEHDDIMNAVDEMLEAAKENGGVTRELNDMDIRRMIIRRKYLLQEKEKTKQMADIVASEWKQRINRKDEQIEQINQTIESYVKNRGESLALDVATVGTRTVKHKIEIADIDELTQMLEKQNMKEQFLKAPVLDETAIKNYFIKTLDEAIEKLEEDRKKKLDDLDQQYSDETKDIKKAADKKPIQSKYADLKKEVRNQHDAKVAETIKQFQEWIPGCVNYVPADKSLYVKMN
ncbi:hypothetical protein TCA2_4441 [Paenibacillus sp. TCA20]|uniref:DUF1351 domain-containing protein n=1 Tax=Paenibacillus urinalis TaxID=521520 RepID=A0ABY7XHF2_9BACL|nr:MULTISPECIES: hypothetical protein [Paenibacillus]WDI05222.1 hypothetical protein PUW25_25780 [Paenibacillus urinalis]GAK41949.1 hypothetical protein TCA2_4441 [Paenibacillus sp. TCA20]